MRRVRVIFGGASSGSGFIYFNALMDLVLVASVMPLIILFYMQSAVYLEDLDAGKLEWRLFTADLQNYLTAVDSIELINEGSGFRVTRDIDEYDIELFGTVIRKQRFNKGHEIMLTDIITCTFRIDGQLLKVTAQLKNGTEERTEYAITRP
ncbi:ComGF family competence protein [Planococcus sp. CAU13]|uniref:ComGF family competence protein n=1 Tax=Planococcus sp. CAU13 TaxID=1541197 RepID=UPI00052FEF0A|nr:ComGF family competence protein [Planococcus sp. CAU13]